jgi:hypothetical protein
MRRARVYFMALVGIVVLAGTGRLFAVLDGEDTPVFIPVDVGRESQPERFTVALGDMIVFHAFNLSLSQLSLTVGGPVESSPKLQAPFGDVGLRILGESGVLGEMSVISFANFHDGKLQLDYHGMKGTFVKAKKVGKAKVEVTTHRGGTRREMRDFEITVVEKRKKEIPVAGSSVQ